MKALSIDSSFAMAIFEGEKTVECRTWKTDYRGDILICANSHRAPGCISGRALIVAHLADIVPFTPDHLENACMRNMPDRPCYAWIFDGFTNIVPFKQKGQLNLFNVDDEKVIEIDFDDDAEAQKYLDNIIAPLMNGYKEIAPIDHAFRAKFADDLEIEESFFS